MSVNRANTGRAVIFTALSVEYEAVRAHLSDIHEETYKGTVYERGHFKDAGWNWEVSLVQVGAGNTSTAFEAERAIDHFQPEIALFVGVAGGLKDVSIGDVVAATKVHGYESGKVQDSLFLARPDVGESSYRLIQRARAEGRNGAWLQRARKIDPSFTATPRAFVGPIAAGEKVIADIRSEVFQFLHTHYNDALAVEMEGRGFLQATHGNEQVQALVIRGISDLIANKDRSDVAGKQQLAAHSASAFAFEILAKLDAPVAPQKNQAVHQATTQSTKATAPASSPSGDTPSIEIFYSYVAKDEKLAQELQKQLSILKRLNVITDWYANMVAPGMEHSQEILSHLNSANIILLLVSPDYLASEQYDTELLRAMERHEAQEATVIPILLRPTDGWEEAPFGKLQALPRNGQKSITEWDNRDTAFAQVAREIRKVVEKLKQASE